MDQFPTLESKLFNSKVLYQELEEAVYEEQYNPNSEVEKT